MTLTRNIWMIATLAVLTAPALGQGMSVVDTKHNLSVSGPGAIRAATEQRICFFCHTPHRSSPIQPMWNRGVPATPYISYTSSSLDAQPGQPTGASKLCLSCHDGSIALGSVFSQQQVIQMAGGITTLPPGTANLGTDLSDDHPISFPYDAQLATLDAHLRNPHTLPGQLRLDANRELQCTTCHDPHDNSFGRFLVMDNSDSSLCRSCHEISSTTIEAHENCSTCHRSHSAPSGPFLLVADRVTDTCLDCHDGSRSGAANIESALFGLSVHDTDSPIDPADPVPGHVTCADCHDPHTMMTGSGGVQAISPSFGEVEGVSSSGATLAQATFEYEVCYRCHGDVNIASSSWIPRKITEVNTRLEFGTSAISYHPVQIAGRNPDVPSLKPGWTETSVLSCSDCHGSDTSRKSGGSGPDGLHGSNVEPLLLARYDTYDNAPESASAYALCYRCHERESGDGVLQDRSFPHNLHVVGTRAPCSVCHDAHGIASTQGTSINNSHLINFDLRVVFPDPVNGLLDFVDTGTFSGNCTLTCHGKLHFQTAYER
jgi:predicted CXXCH cytochrome family protein